MQQVETEVKTIAALGNVALAARALHRATNAPSHLPHIVVFSGPSGFGKTSAASYLATRYGAYYVECRSTTTRKSLLEMILKRMGIPAEKTVNAMLDQVCDQLEHSGRCLIIDEMDYLVDKSVVAIVQDIYEGSNGSPMMLIGEESLPKKLKKWERFHGRILDWTAAQPADLEDVATLASFYCDRAKIAPDLLAHVHSVARGSVRRVCVNLDLVQEEALTKGLSIITLADWGNRPLYTGDAPARRG